MDPVQTRSTRSSAALPWMEPAEDLAALAAGWLPFSAPELRRLRFVAYRRATGRLRPSGPLHPTGAHVCAEIAAYLHAPAPQPVPQVRVAAAVDVPPLWQAWLEAHKRDDPGR